MVVCEISFWLPILGYILIVFVAGEITTTTVHKKVHAGKGCRNIY